MIEFVIGGTAQGKLKYVLANTYLSFPCAVPPITNSIMMFLQK